MNSSLSFEEAIKVASELLKEADSASVNPRTTESLRELLNATASARGLFVALLTGEWSFDDQIPQSIIDVCTNSGPVADELLAKNLIMSSCTRVHHLRAGNVENASGSLRVIRRTSYIIEQQAKPSQSLTDELSSMKEAIESVLTDADQIMEGDRGNKYKAFLIKWKYDKEQLTSANEALSSVLARLA